MNRYKPKRLLDIGLDAQSELKLVDGEQARLDLDGLRYAALSYCWGPEEESRKQLKLTTGVQRMFYGRISVTLIPPVLRDAITVCRLLGIRYLWIDALCIQQDGDSKDWEEQSQEMSHIFGNAWLTICALASNSCLEGFLDHIDRHSHTIEIGYLSDKSRKVQGSFSLSLLTLNGEPGFEHSGWVARSTPLARDINCSRWNTRGWVFQERILSPRLLYFGSRMVHFQHGDHVVSEDGSSIDNDFFESRSLPGSYCATNLVHQLEVIQNQGPFITDLWYRLVALMSSSDFTDRRDIFPSIAGAARRVHEFTNLRYLAGLWEQDLCCGLLWRPDRVSHATESQRPPASLRQLLQILKKSTSLIAPSWSWASRRSILCFIITNKTNTTCRVRRHLRPEFTILQSRVLVNGVNPYGRIESASISLLASTTSITLYSPVLVEGMGHKEVLELFPNLFVFLRPDWEPNLMGRRPRRASGIKKHMRDHFHLLLIASCCSYRRICRDGLAAHSPPRGDGAVPAPQPAADPDAGVLSVHKRLGLVDEKTAEAMKPHYRTSFYEDSHPGFDAAVHCDRCSDHTLRRDIWGLLIYPAGPADTYYRVGTFFSRAGHGGSAIFDGVESRRIDLV